MYVLIVAIHAIFIGIAHLLEYRVFEGVFLLLGCFFLFYFSPLFFLDESEKWEKKRSVKEIFSSLSLRESFLLPIALLYIALYLLFFSIFWQKEDILFIHSSIIIGIYLLFFGYFLGFHWKRDLFFESLRFHTVFTLASTVIIFCSKFFLGNTDHISLLLLLLGMTSWVFLLSYKEKETPPFIVLFLISLFVGISGVYMAIFPTTNTIPLLAILLLLSFLTFELFPRFPIFLPYISTLRYFWLIVSMSITAVLVFFVFREMASAAILLILFSILFFFRVHIRFTNYIAYLIGIFLIFFLYSMIFSWLISPSTPASTFLFLFFLPILLIGITYLFDEAHDYDFTILHYSSIVFGIVFSIYTIFFIWWWGDILFILSLCIFGIAFLLFLSYFRFRAMRDPSHH